MTGILKINLQNKVTKHEEHQQVKKKKPKDTEEKTIIWSLVNTLLKFNLNPSGIQYKKKKEKKGKSKAEYT